jgi:hypothetical protein
MLTKLALAIAIACLAISSAQAFEAKDGLNGSPYKWLPIDNFPSCQLLGADDLSGPVVFYDRKNGISRVLTIAAKPEMCPKTFALGSMTYTTQRYPIFHAEKLVLRAYPKPDYTSYFIVVQTRAGTYTGRGFSPCGKNGCKQLNSPVAAPAA